MIVEITQDDIDNGVKKSCKMCPAALAVGRLFPGLDVQVGLLHIFVGENVVADKYHLKALIPGSLYIFINKFDSGQAVEPLTFEVNFEDICNAG